MTATEKQFELAHEIMALFVLRKLILQTRMRSHPVGLDVWFLVGPFVYFHTSCVRTAKALARLRGCAGSHEPSLVAYVISTIISWAGSFCYDRCFCLKIADAIKLNLFSHPVHCSSFSIWFFFVSNQMAALNFSFTSPFLLKTPYCLALNFCVFCLALLHVDNLEFLAFKRTRSLG